MMSHIFFGVRILRYYYSMTLSTVSLNIFAKDAISLIITVSLVPWYDRHPIKFEKRIEILLIQIF